MCQSLISVVIPYYDRPALVLRAIRSVERQTYRPVEIVLVDDASPGDIGATLGAAGLSIPLLILRHEGNAGPSAARNTGLAAARGDLVAFLDSDDEWLPGKLERQVADLARAARPDETVAIARTHMRRGAAILPCALWDRDVESLAAFFFVSEGTMQTSSILLSRRLAREIGFDASLRQFEDMLFLMKAAERGADFIYQSERLVDWNRDERPDQLSRSLSLGCADRFLSQAGPALDERARLAFQVRIMGPALVFDRPAQAMRLAWLAWRRGLVTLRNLAGLARKAHAYWQDSRPLSTFPKGRSVDRLSQVAETRGDGYPDK